MQGDPVPPSVNELYTTFRGKRVLTKKGRNFKDALSDRVAKECLLHDPPWKHVMENVYIGGARARLTINLSVDLFNPAWVPGKRTAKKHALQNPYQTLDSSNYVKAIEDGLAEGTGIDDSITLTHHIEKIPGPRYIEVFYEVLYDSRAR